MINNSDLIAKLHTSQILVGLDLGEKTIGIAVSDQSLIIATPLKTILRKYQSHSAEVKYVYGRKLYSPRNFIFFLLTNL